VPLYSYDAAGNLLADGTHHYAYDAEGNMTQVDNGATATYVYDALNHRVRDTTSAADTYYSYNTDGERVGSWSAGGATPTLLAAYSYWNGVPLATYTSAGTFYSHQDLLGTKRLTTTSTGTTAGSYKSLPFGDGYTASGTDPDASHFGLLDHDTESDTDHAQLRQYANTSASWMSPDPYDGSYDAGNPQSFNRYTYALNNPLAYIDPTGQDPADAMEQCYLVHDPRPDPLPDQTVCILVSIQSVTVNENGGYTFSDPDSFYESQQSALNAPQQFTFRNPANSFTSGYTAPNNPSAPNNGRSFLSCTFTAKTGLALGTTLLDAVGTIPVGGNIVHGIQLGATVISTGLAVFGSFTGAGLSATGAGLTLADKTGVSIAVHGTELIPIAGNIVSAIATGVDIFGEDGVIATYKGCMAGGKP
jgi:RHS repeat-associated protein